jgi:hypothetical protein
MLDIRRALEFLTDDERAQTKIAIGGLLMVVPLANIAAVGYEVQVARRVARAEPRPLPEWNDLGGLFVTGAWLSLARLIFYLPMFAAMIISGIAWFTFLFEITDSRRQGMSPFGLVLIIAVVALFGAAIVYGFVLSFVFPAIFAEYVRRGTFASCFDFAAIFSFIRRDPRQYTLVCLAELGLALIVAAVTAVVVLPLSLVPCLGTLAVTFVTGLCAFIIIMFNSHLVGQLMRAGANPVLAKE